MFKKLILIIGLILIVGAGFFLLTQKQSNDENSVAMYGRFTDDHYISEYLGVDIDMSDNWVYFTDKTVGDGAYVAAEEYGVDLEKLLRMFAESNVFLSMMKPGTPVVFIDNGERFDDSDFVHENITEFGGFMRDVFKQEIDDCSLLNAGTVESGQFKAAYFTLHASYNGRSDLNLIYSYFNTEKTGIVSMCMYNNNADPETFMELLRKKVTLLYYDETAEI